MCSVFAHDIFRQEFMCLYERKTKQRDRLKEQAKAIVNGIVDELAKEDQVAECYQKWLECQNEILRYYKDTLPASPLLSEQKEFKSIKNMIIREAVRFGINSRDGMFIVQTKF